MRAHTASAATAAVGAPVCAEAAHHALQPANLPALAILHYAGPRSLSRDVPSMVSRDTPENVACVAAARRGSVAAHLRDEDMNGYKPDGWRAVTPRVFTDNIAGLVGFLKAVFGAGGELRSGRIERSTGERPVGLRDGAAVGLKCMPTDN
jgi:hypothetical protein